MNRLVTAAAAAILLAAPLASAATWQIDPAHSQASFQVKHMMVSKVNGTFKSLNGTIEFDPAKPEATTINAEIDATTIDTNQPKRDGHLQSPDFFDVKNHPKITFKSTKVTRGGEGKYKVDGDLTIRGVTKPAVLEVEGWDTEVNTPAMMGGGKKRGATATTTIHRKDFGVNWNAALDNGGVVVSNDVKVTLEIEANLKTDAAEKGAKAESKK